MATTSWNATSSLEVTCKTKLNKDDANPVTSKVTIVFDNEKDTLAFAARSAIIAWQALQRDAGTISETDSVNVSELAKRSGRGGFKATPESLANRVSKMSIDDYRATLAKLGLDAKTIDRMAKQHEAKLPKVA